MNGNLFGDFLPIPAFSAEMRKALLDCGAQFPNQSLADLYDPLTMPPELVKAHAKLEALVDKAYGRTFANDAERVAHLFNSLRRSRKSGEGCKMRELAKHKNEIVVYQPNDVMRLEVMLKYDTVWLNRQQISQLFGRDIKTIGKHIANALQEELAPVNANFATTESVAGNPTVAKYATVQKEGRREVVRQVEYYNLEMIRTLASRSSRSPNLSHPRQQFSHNYRDAQLLSQAKNRKTPTETFALTDGLTTLTPHTLPCVCMRGPRAFHRPPEGKPAPLDHRARIFHAHPRPKTLTKILCLLLCLHRR